jgi:hypothetical protein
MKATDESISPAELERLQQDLERRVKRAVEAYEAETDGPLELDMSFVPDEGHGPADEKLGDKIASIVEDFHRMPAIEASKVRVHKVTALDSDEDGRAVVRIQYDYPDY